MAASGRTHELLTAAIAAGLTYAQAAEVASVSTRTVRRRMSEPTFVAEVAHVRADQVEQTTARLSALTASAVEVLEDLLREGPPGLRLRAAQAVLAESRAHREADVERRLAVLEQSLGLAA